MITIPRFDDMHCHFRNGDLLTHVVPCSAAYCGRAVAMPNLRPLAVLTANDAVAYRFLIEQAIAHLSAPPDFKPLMTIEIRDYTTPMMIKLAARAGVVAGKVYPRGVTTNSDEGLRDFRSFQVCDVFLAMRDEGLLLLLHGELDEPRTLVTKREEAFLPILTRLAEWFPDLKIVLEHVSTSAGVELVKSLPDNVAGTITAHHLCLTLNDVIGNGLQPHHACNPMPKEFDDRDALIAAAVSGNPKFFLGSDSAPHRRGSKECARGACGVFTAPVLPALLAEIFEDAGRLDRLEDFTSRFGAEFYGLKRNTSAIHLDKIKWVVPPEIGGVVPFRAGTEMRWKQVEIK